jgi:anti-anti-sigma factor
LIFVGRREGWRVPEAESWSMRTLVGDDLVCVVLGGEIDLGAADALGDELDAVFDEHGVPVVLDLHEVTFIDSSGMRVLLLARKRSAAEGRTLTVVNASLPARRVIELSGTAALFALDPAEAAGAVFPSAVEEAHRARRAAAHHRAGDVHATAAEVHSDAAALFDEHQPDLAEHERDLASKNQAAMLEQRERAGREADGEV